MKKFMGICLVLCVMLGCWIPATAEPPAAEQAVPRLDLSREQAAQIINELKLMLSETEQMSDEELAQTIQELAEKYNIHLKDSQVQQLIDLCRGLEKLDGEALKEKVEQVQESLEKLSETQEKVSRFAQTVKQVMDSVRGFIDRILAFFELRES